MNISVLHNYCYIDSACHFTVMSSIRGGLSLVEVVTRQFAGVRAEHETRRRANIQLGLVHARERHAL